MGAYAADNGTWYTQFYVVDWTGKRKKVMKRGFKLKRDALAYEHDFKAKEQGRPDMTFQALYELYREDYSHRVRPSTIEIKDNISKKWLIPYFGEIPVNKITPVTVRKWENEIINKGLSATFLKAVYSQLSAVFNFAVKYCNLDKNPVHAAGSIGSYHRDQINFWTLPEFKRFMGVVDMNNPYAAMIETLFFTGMREGELLAITPADIDGGRLLSMSEEDFTTYPHSIDVNKTLYNGRIGPPKTPKSKRVISIPVFLAAFLRAFIRRQYGIGDNERIFNFSKHPLLRFIKKYAPIAGVKPIRVHDLRHSHASLLIEKGFSPLVIKERLGHENIQTTLQTYSHLYPSQEKVLISTLEGIGKEIESI